MEEKIKGTGGTEQRQKLPARGFPGGPETENPPAKAAEEGRSLVWEDPTCHRTSDRCTPTTGLTLCNESSHHSQQPEGACAAPPPPNCQAGPGITDAWETRCEDRNTKWVCELRIRLDLRPWGARRGACSRGDPGGGRDLGRKFVPGERLRGSEPGWGGRGWMPEWGVK